MEFEKIQQIVADVLKVAKDEVVREARFVEDFGADSLDLFQMLIELENEFSIEVPAETAEQLHTVGDVENCVIRCRG